MMNNTPLKNIAGLSILVFVWFFTHGFLFSENPKPTLALINGYIIDGNGGAPIQNGVILIAGEKIAEVDSTEEITIPRSRTPHRNPL